ncbi:MAG: DUF378 domain-containing protein [Patescibacteria group bacterium]
MFKDKCTVCGTVCVLVVIGALNWGLVGLGGFLGRDLNVVNMLLGAWPYVEWIVYILIGLAGVMMIFSSKCPCNHKKDERDRKVTEE